MAQKLVLTLTGEHLALELMNPVTTHGFHGLLGRFARFRQSAPVAVPPGQVTRVDVSMQIVAGSLDNALEHAWGELKKTHAASLYGGDLEVHLGLAHARLGLLLLADAHTTTITSDLGAVYAKAWVGQMWGIDPASQIIRWQALEDKQKLLISCVDRQIFEGLEAFSRRHSIQFVSCKPALLTAMSEYGRQSDDAKSSATGATTLIWTETSATARRSDVVQLLRYEGGQLQALWRGWLTAPTSLDGTDDALQGAVRRFLAWHQGSLGDVVRYQHWPNLSPAPQPLATAS